MQSLHLKTINSANYNYISFKLIKIRLFRILEKDLHFNGFLVYAENTATKTNKMGAPKIIPTLISSKLQRIQRAQHQNAIVS